MARSATVRSIAGAATPTRADGTVRCWGGESDDDECRAPQLNCGQGVSPAGTFSQIVAGHYSNCGLTTSGTIACWGAGTTTGSCGGSDLNCGQATPPDETNFKTLGLVWLRKRAARRREVERVSGGLLAGALLVLGEGECAHLFDELGLGLHAELPHAGRQQVADPGA